MDTLRLSSAVAALLLTGAAQALTGGLHLHSMHTPAQEADNNLNRGAYVRTDGGLMIGAYRNTYRRLSPYVAQTIPVGPFDLALGVIGGYQRKGDDGFSCGYLSPLAAISYAMPVQLMGVTPRLTLVPGHLVKARTVLHLSVERQF